MNIIQSSTVSSIKANEIYLSNQSASGNATITAASGASILIKNNRPQFSNKSSNYSININESCGVWINSAAITYSLPVNAPSGTAALFIRTGDTVTINPTVNGRIWNSGSFLPFGTTRILSSSGCKYGLINNGANGWLPILEEGIII